MKEGNQEKQGIDRLADPLHMSLADFKVLWFRLGLELGVRVKVRFSTWCRRYVRVRVRVSTWRRRYGRVRVRVRVRVRG